VTDFDQVNGPDIAVMNEDSLAILFNRGDGTFETELTFPTGSWSFDILIADFDGENGPDWAAINRAGDSVSVSLNCVGGSCLTSTWLLRYDDVTSG